MVHTKVSDENSDDNEALLNNRTYVILSSQDLSFLKAAPAILEATVGDVLLSFSVSYTLALDI